LSKPILYGADYSVYVRIARMALLEKGVDHELVPVDVFADAGAPDWYRAKQPFGRIPAFEHDGFALYETSAICRYVDEAFAGPGLQSASVRDRAGMQQIVALLDSYAYRPLVWGISVEMVAKPAEGGVTDPAVVETATPIAETSLAELARLQNESGWLAGEALSLADLHAAPIIGYFLKAPIAAAMLGRHPSIQEWWQRVSARASWTSTEPTS
jgi:glutathione S-transferase